ncbi:MAG TPA: thioredoxin [Candidatus Latescibacteria bacterium]|jgi:thioredoxin 1|nr:thioredoxin [Gemmatimonadaceae bacterium]MDP6014836.1 thioredoxin [Candidatus Latescibacterota bacterium]HJP34192.1 thioredoxin [Candidatus Latescibacterota bacterium]|tara:strand:+ start:765 stop:1097 length:333 start_codon:yes stop_codon:yes gene_type:complete
MAEPLVVTDDTFEAEVLQATEPVLVDFGATWCGPCRTLEPIVEELAREYAGRVKVAKLDADDHPQTVAKFQIRGLPTLLFFRGGQVQDTLVGVAAKGQLTEKLDAVLQAA